MNTQQSCFIVLESSSCYIVYRPMNSIEVMFKFHNYL